MIMNRLKWFLIGLAATVGLGTLAAVPGGFPSRPIFQSARVLGNVTAGTPNSTPVSISTPSHIVADTAPTYWLDETDQAAGSRWWGMQVNSGIMNLEYCPDNLSGCTNALSINRASGAVTVTGTPNNYSFQVIGSGTVGQSFGEIVVAGTNASDGGLTVQNAAQNKNLLQVLGDGSILGYGPTATVQVDMRPDRATTTGTITGCTTSPTTGVRLTKMGGIVTVSINGTVVCTSNANTFTLTGAVPTAFQPATEQDVPVAFLQDNGTVVPAIASTLNGSATITFSRFGANWTNSGSKGFGGVGTVFSYQLN